jgi:hypothetical protein
MFIEVDAAGCTDTCRHCAVDGRFPHGSFYSVDELRALKQTWGPLTIRYEPTAHPDFPTIYSADIAVDHGGWLVTNGFGLARRDDYTAVVAQMHEMGIHTIAFTLHGLAAHHDWFVCRQGAFADILQATRRVKGAGFSPKWQIYVDQKGIGDVAAVVDTAVTECGDLPWLSLPYHRVGGRLRHYEKIRPTLADVYTHRLDQLVEDPEKNMLLGAEGLTAVAWLEKWKQSPDVESFTHPFEPPTWPPSIDNEMLTIRITRDHKLYLDPLVAPPLYLGKLAESKQRIMERLGTVAQPPCAEIDLAQVEWQADELERLHPSGFSVRYLAITKTRLEIKKI